MFKLVFRYIRPVLSCFVLFCLTMVMLLLLLLLYFHRRCASLEKAVQAAAACPSSDGKRTRCIYVISFDDRLISRVAGRGRRDAS